MFSVALSSILEVLCASNLEFIECLVEFSVLVLVVIPRCIHLDDDNTSITI